MIAIQRLDEVVSNDVLLKEIDDKKTYRVATSK